MILELDIKILADGVKYRPPRTNEWSTTFPNERAAIDHCIQQKFNEIAHQSKAEEEQS